MPSRLRYVAELLHYLKASGVCFWRADPRLAARPVLCLPAGWIDGAFLAGAGPDAFEMLYEPGRVAECLPLALRARLREVPQALLHLRRALPGGGALGVFVAWDAAQQVPADVLRQEGLIELVLDVLVRGAEATPLQDVADAQMRALAESLPQAVALVHPEGALGYVNANAAALLGVAAGEIAAPELARALQGMIGRAGDAADIREQARAMLDLGAQARGSTRLWHFPHGSPRALRVTLAPVRGRSTTWAWLFEDVSVEVGLQQQLQAEEHKLRDFFEHLDEAVALYALDGSIQQCNDRFVGLFGARAHSWHDEAHAYDASAGPDWQGLRGDCLLWQTLGPYEGHVRMHDGAERWIEASAMLRRDAAGEPVGIWEVVRDITERKSREAQLLFRGTHDETTSLPNRTLFLEHLRQELRRSDDARCPVGVLVLALGERQSLASVAGNSSAQQALRHAAARLGSLCAAPFLVARIAETRFAVHGPTASERELRQLGERLQRALAEPFDVGGAQSVLDVAVGLSLCGQDATEAEDLLLQAEAALQRARQPGMDPVQAYSPLLLQDLRARFELEQALRRALARGEELFLAYQPQLRAGDARLHGCEALLRWSRADGSLVSPASFVPVAEGCGLIGELTEWVLHEACRQLRAWDEQGLAPGLLSLNLSAVHFQDEDMVASLLDILRHHDVAPQRMCLEITETAMADPVASGVKLAELKAAGFAVSVDDFGTGYSSLSYLKRFAVDELKIDRSFVSGIEEQASDRAIVAAIVTMAHGLGLRVVAEGVETQAQLDFLRQRDCDFAQGYWFARPMPAAAFTAWMRERRFL
ncbi:MAG: EAL domain-containing protein [Betaproteobacteria bacterium]|nr:EAL domain-containing protein [Betaproteobacteria bacterium]MDE2152787.1 EAL domain-containing protein [Betaproteobacteria bacterium]